MLIRYKCLCWLSAFALGFCFVGLGPENEAAAQQPAGTLPPVRTQQNPQVPRNNPTVQPRAVQPRAAQPRSAQPNATQPRTTQPGTLPPRSNQPGVYAPRSNPVNSVQPRTTQPRTMPAGATPPGTQRPVSRPPVAAYRPLAPFRLTPAEKAFRDQVLLMWEKEGEKISTYKVDFERWKYLKAFAVPGRDAPNIKEKGTLAYSKPDKGSFKVKEISYLKVGKSADGKPLDSWPVSKGAVGENWVCDGKNVYRFNTKAKQLEVSQIPKELQGKSIVDGPLPFLFGAKAETLKKRYWIRVTKADQKEIWIDSYPKFINDARNYKHVELVLDRKTLLPKAMQVHEPNGDRNVYMFGHATVNSTFDRLFNPFRAPSTPYNWKRVIIPVPKQQAPGNPTGPTARQRPPARMPLQPRVNQPGTRPPGQPANRSATLPTRRPRF